jgi:hypothetical protein
MVLFRQGLNPVLHEHLTLFWGCTLNELVSTSIEQEDACCARMEEERKNRPLFGHTRGAAPKYRLVYTPPSGQPCGHPLPEQRSHRQPQQVAPCLLVYPQLAAPPRALQPVGVGFPCLNCGQTGHFAQVSPALKVLLSQGPITAWHSAEHDDPSTFSESRSCQLHYG